MMKRILIVDDIPEYIDTIEAYLEDRLEVLKAGGLQEAKNILTENLVAIAIVDIRLKEDDPENKEGLELLRWIKEQMPDVKIIVMSAYREFDYKIEAIEAGADYFIPKPLNPDELNSIVDRLL
jgi:two-component system response regulator AtoC